MSQETVLESTSLRKSFGKRTLFSEVNLCIRRRERVALLGASGSGKSTLLHCLSGVMPVDGGEIKICNETLDTSNQESLARCRRENIGTVFQFFHILPTLTAAENVELPLQLLGLTKKKRKYRVQALLNRMGIESRANAFPSELSGGEMQRVAIARAVAHRPPIIFADEPTGNLDQKSGEEVLRLLRELTDEEDAALFMVTHSEEAAAICQRRFNLDEGSLNPV